MFRALPVNYHTVAGFFFFFNFPDYRSVKPSECVGFFVHFQFWVFILPQRSSVVADTFHNHGTYRLNRIFDRGNTSARLIQSRFFFPWVFFFVYRYFRGHNIPRNRVTISCGGEKRGGKGFFFFGIFQLILLCLSAIVSRRKISHDRDCLGVAYGTRRV